MTIAPLVPAERDQRIEAQRAVTAAEAEELAARQRLQRLEQLLKDGAASVRSVEEARAQHQVTRCRAHRRARAAGRRLEEPGRRARRARRLGAVRRRRSTRLRRAGTDGRRLRALLEIAQIDTLWVRVAVYAGDAGGIDDDATSVTVRKLGATDGPDGRDARHRAAQRRSLGGVRRSLLRAVRAARARFRPGERVLVELPLTTTEKGLVVPEAAVLYDIHGATWVYEDLGGNAYARRRIEVARHAGDRAVVSRGIAEGAKVVTAGAAELFGTEFGAGH